MVDPISYVKKKVKNAFTSAKIRILGDTAKDIEEKRDEIQQKDEEESGEDD